MSTKELSYKNALVTGASSGLGHALTRWFASRGVKVYACARRQEPLRALAGEIVQAGGQCEVVAMDVRSVDEVVKTIRRLDAESTGLDLVIANAGVGSDGGRDRFSWEQVRETIEVNAVGAAATVTAVLPRMVERGRGHIVGISSIAAYRGLPGHAAYSASKAFLATFLEGMRADLRTKGVKVTSIHPGYVKSELTAKNGTKMPFLLETEDAVDRMGRAIVRGDAEFCFPWQMSMVATVLKHLPNGLFDMAVKNALPRNEKS